MEKLDLPKAKAATFNINSDGKWELNRKTFAEVRKKITAKTTKPNRFVSIVI